MQWEQQNSVRFQTELFNNLNRLCCLNCEEKVDSWNRNYEKLPSHKQVLLEKNIALPFLMARSKDLIPGLSVQLSVTLMGPLTSICEQQLLTGW